MLHIHSHTPLDQLQFRNALHKATEIEFAIMQQDFAVETPYGTMTGRAGDILARDAEDSSPARAMWVMTRYAFHKNYAEAPAR